MINYDTVQRIAKNTIVLLVSDTDKMSVEEEVEAVLRKVKELGYLKAISSL